MNEPKKPRPEWAQEPTPLCNAEERDGFYFSDQGNKFTLKPWEYERTEDGEVVPAVFARDLERRLRHAWKLVNSLRIDCMPDERDGGLDPELLEERLSDIEEVLQ